MQIFLAIMFIIGIAVGTALPIWIQGVVLVLAIMYLNSSSVKAMEIGAIFPMVIIGWFFIGVFVGDISYMFQTSAWESWSIPNPFIAKG